MTKNTVIGLVLVGGIAAGTAVGGYLESRNEPAASTVPTTVVTAAAEVGDVASESAAQPTAPVASPGRTGALIPGAREHLGPAWVMQISPAWNEGENSMGVVWLLASGQSDAIAVTTHPVQPGTLVDAFAPTFLAQITSDNKYTDVTNVTTTMVQTADGTPMARIQADALLDERSIRILSYLTAGSSHIVAATFTARVARFDLTVGLVEPYLQTVRSDE